MYLCFIILFACKVAMDMDSHAYVWSMCGKQIDLGHTVDIHRSTEIAFYDDVYVLSYTYSYVHLTKARFCVNVLSFAFLYFQY